MSESTGLTVALVDDHPAILRAVISEIMAAFPMSEVCQSKDVDEVLATPGPYLSLIHI